jgi:hypothetical protein
MMDYIKSKISNIIDADSYKINNMVFSFSFIDNNDLLVLHIYNPNNEELVVNSKNRDFYDKVSKMLFVKDKNNKHKGCFNHQRNDDDKLYNQNITVFELINSFLKIQYTFILINLKNNDFTPVSLFCLVDNYIYDVCTSYYHRNKRYMTKLFTHFIELVKTNKLKNGTHKTIQLDVVKVNPDFKMVIDYYKKFGFKITDNLDNKIIMAKKI